MKAEKRENKVEEIRVLDRGKNFDDPVITSWWCCVAPFFLLRNW